MPLIASYAIVGFANFSSIAIQIGGIGGLAPDRKSEIARLGLRGMIAGNLSAFMSACWAGHAAVTRCDPRTNMTLLAELTAAAAYVTSRSDLKPRIGLVLGSGLGAFAKSLDGARRHPVRQRSRTSPPRPRSATAASSSSGAPRACRWR